MTAPAIAEEQVKRLMEMFGKEEPLIPELQVRLIEGAMFPYINHPFLCSVPHFPGQNAWANQLVAEKRKRFDEDIANGEWEAINAWIEKPFRIEYLLKYQSQIPDEKYWPILHNVWTSVENLYQYKREIPLLFKGRPGVIRECFRDERDWQLWSQLPESICVYRGCTVLNKLGWSWTLDREKAVWFSKRLTHGRRPIVAEAEVRKDDCHFYTNCRNESEVVVNPKKLKL